MKKYAGATKCPYCKEYIQYEDKDIKAEYVKAPSNLLNGVDLFMKWIECPKCGKKVEL